MSSLPRNTAPTPNQPLPDPARPIYTSRVRGISGLWR